MTKKILTFLTFVVLSCATIKTARAECDGFYLAGRVGFAEFKLEDDRPNGLSNLSDYIIDKKRFLASGALGYRYKHVRAELEYIWRDSNTGNVAGFTDATFKSYSYMFALYYDFFPYSWFTPYINAGIGYSKSKLSLYNKTVGINHKFKDNSFMWSLGAGISVKVTNRLNVDLGYRYFDLEDSFEKFNGNTTMDNQEVYLGLRYVL